MPVTQPSIPVVRPDAPPISTPSVVKVADPPVVFVEEDPGRRRPLWLWLLGLLALVAALAFVLTKCGNDDDTGGNQPVPAGSTQTTAPTQITEPAVASTTLAPSSSTTIAEPTTTVAQQAVTVVEAAAAQEDLSTFTAAVSAAGLQDALAGDGPFSVFAPSDEAFAALPAGVLDALLKPENKEALTEVLQTHVVAQRLEGETLVSGSLPNGSGGSLTLKTDGTNATIANASGSAAVVGQALASDNGVVYTIDRVLLPEGFELPGVDGLEPTATSPATVTTTTVSKVPPTTTTTVASAGNVKNAAGDPVPDSLTIYFNTDSSSVRDGEQPKIDAAVALLRALPSGSQVRIVGFADSRGNAVDNRIVSQARADSVVTALRNGLGFDSVRIVFTTVLGDSTNPFIAPEVARRVTIELPR